MFKNFKKKRQTDVWAVVEGKVKSLDLVEDQMFSKGLIGRGLAIVPSSNTISAPVEGTLSVVFPTGHAFGITTNEGLEFLIHIGVDTVTLKGEGFHLLVQQGQKIKQGDPLVTVDFGVLKEKGYASDTMVIVTSSDEICSIQEMLGDETAVKESHCVLFRCVQK